MKHIELPCYNIKISVEEISYTGFISSDLKEICKYCGDKHCKGNCAGTHEYVMDRDWEEQQRKRDEIINFNNFNNNIDIIESMILSHAIAGVDVESPAYLEGIETVVDKYLNISI